VKEISRGDWQAIALISFFVWWPLFMAALPNFVPQQVSEISQHAVNQDEWQRIIAGTHITDWILTAVGIGQLVILGVQAGIYHRQRVLMEGQLKATQTAAEASLAALERPWLIVEGFKLNEKDWIDCVDPLIAEFEIANYGKAPAFIKRIVVCHFRGPHHHNGFPSSVFPEGVLRFPEKDDLAAFLNRNGKVTLREIKIFSDGALVGTENKNRRAFLNVSNHNFIISGGGRSETFCAWGQAPLTTFVKGIPIFQTTESYFIGSIYYEFPGNQAELMRFCYKSNGRGGFDLYRDYAPYNETKNAKTSQK
jgi:hypothetical protein